MWPVTPRGSRDALPRQLREEGEETGKEGIHAKQQGGAAWRGGPQSHFSSSTPSYSQEVRRGDKQRKRKERETEALPPTPRRSQEGEV